MTAARLRTAAAKLREVAEGATPGPWNSTWDNQVVGGYGSPHDGEQLMDCFDSAVNAEFVATMSPVVALAMATLLDSDPCDCPPCSCCGTAWECFGCDVRAEALAVADAVLGAEVAV